jgi:hypothetical protein
MIIRQEGNESQMILTDLVWVEFTLLQLPEQIEQN